MATVIRDTMSGVAGTSLTGRNPDTTNVPGNVYTFLNLNPALQLTGTTSCTAAAAFNTGTAVQANTVANGGVGAAGIYDGVFSIDVILPNQAVVGTYRMAAGLLLRLANGAAENYWMLDIENTANGIAAYEVHLKLFTGHAIAADHTVLSGQSWNNSTHTISVSVKGNVYTVSVDGVPQTPYTDATSTYITAVTCGPFTAFTSVGTIYANCKLTNFVVSTLALIITQTTLPNGQISSPYSQTLTSTGGYPYGGITYAVTAGALPPGLSLSAGGVLSGTPTTAGTYSFTATATDTLADTGTQAFTLVVTGGAMSFYLVRPDAQQTPATRRFQQGVAQIVNGLMYSGSIVAISGGGFRTGGIAIGDSISGGHYTAAPTGGDVLFVGNGVVLAQDDNFRFLATADGGPILTVTGGQINAPAGSVTAAGITATTSASVGAGGLVLVSSFPLTTGFFVANDDGSLSGTAAWIDWGNLVPGPNFPSHVFENSTGGLVARCVVGLLKSGAAPLLAGLSDISISVAPNFLFSIDSTGNYFGPTATYTTTSASALVVTTGTNNCFQVDASAATLAAGVKITGTAAGSGGRIAAISTAIAEQLLLDGKGGSAVGLNTVAGTAAGAGAVVTGSVVITSTGVSAFAVGRQGSTFPVFRADASTGTVVTGILVKGAASGGKAAISVLSSATNEGLTVDAKGSGTIGIGIISTGAITLGTATTITTGNFTVTAGNIAVTSGNVTLTSGNLLLSSGTETITSTSANALAVGRQGTTNPGLNVDASAASCVTGINIQSKATGSGVVLVSTGTATDEGMQFNSKGTGFMSFSCSTGSMTFGCGTFNLTCGGNVTLSGTTINLSSFGNNIVGTNTNDSAAAGSVGEFISSLVATGAALSISAATAKNIASISLTAGDWDVEGNVNFTTVAATFSGLQAGLSSTSATLPTDGSEAYSGLTGSVLSDTDTITLPRKRFSLSTTTTIYLVGYCNVITVGTVSGFGAITARRVR